MPPTTNQYPPWLKWGVALVIVGGTLNVVYAKVSPMAAYISIFIILLWMASTDNFKTLTDFLNQVGITQGN